MDAASLTLTLYRADDEWLLAVEYPDAWGYSWVLHLNGDEIADEEDATLIADYARRSLANYASRRDDPGLTPATLDRFSRLPPPADIAAWPVHLLGVVPGAP